MSTSGPFTVVAHWRMSADRVADVLRLVQSLRKATLTEPGCLGYDVYRSIADENEVLIIERYLDDAAMQAHRQSAHYQDLAVVRIIPKLSHREVQILQARDPA